MNVIHLHSVNQHTKLQVNSSFFKSKIGCFLSPKAYQLWRQTSIAVFVIYRGRTQKQMAPLDSWGKTGPDAGTTACANSFFLFFRRQQCLFFIIRSQSAGQYQCIHSNVAYPMTTLYLKFPCLHVINRPQKQNNTNTALTITITRHTYPTPKHILKINHCCYCIVLS